jgi:hypothetical protein
MTDNSERDRIATSEFIREIRVRIWAWDPIGLARLGAPEDEYDCLVGPVTGALREGLPADVLASRLGGQVLAHFGSQPWEIEAFVADLIRWYRNLSPNPWAGDIGGR